MENKRYLTQHICSDLSDKMVFVGGARQVGKTTLAKQLVAPFFKSSVYYNFDYRSDRKQILNNMLPGSKELLIFDEIHKYPKWKTWIKGMYDVHHHDYKFLITGSARLNIYRKGGDSLQGRYHYYTLYPFSLAEILELENTISPFSELPISSSDHFESYKNLEQYGGFPEIFLKQSDRSLRRWHNEKIERLFREDIRDLENIRDISSMQLLSDLLPDRVGSLLSINSIREDLQVSHRAVTHWLEILEQFYYHFRIYPYHKKQIRSIKKEPKLYLLDWTEVEDPAAKYENMIAIHLLKWTTFLYEHDGYKTKVHFLRNVDKHEVDFLITVDGNPWFCVEAKLTDEQPSASIHYFRDRLKIPFCFQVVRKANVDMIKDNIRILSVDKFLSALI